MNFLEKDLEQIIYEATSEQLFRLSLSGIRKRQLKIPGYGISDLVFISRENRKYINSEARTCNIYDVGLEITVCELKKDKIGISAFLQAVRYCKGIRRYLESRDFHNFKFRILLVGKEMDTTGSLVFLGDLLKDYHDEYCDYEFNKGLKVVDFFTYKYGFNGIEFKEHSDYISTSDNFKMP